MFFSLAAMSGRFFDETLPDSNWPMNSVQALTSSPADRSTGRPYEPGFWNAWIIVVKCGSDASDQLSIAPLVDGTAPKAVDMSSTTVVSVVRNSTARNDSAMYFDFAATYTGDISMSATP